jgi:hypothetical protein
VSRFDHPEVSAVIASEHCLQRFRRRRRISTPGFAALELELSRAFEDAEITALAPAWVQSDHGTQLWALLDDLAFPLAPATGAGEWLALTCLVRGRG